MNPSNIHRSPAKPGPPAPTRFRFSGSAFLRASLFLAASFLIPAAHAQSNYATPYFFTTLAGATAAGAVDGTGNAARFNLPQGVAVDSAGNVYVADTNSHSIRKITFFGVVTTLAGQPGSTGNTDGAGSAARFNLPRGVAVDGAGNVYVADTSNSLIRKITPAGVVTTLAGAGSGSVDGTGTGARFFSPEGIAVDNGGNVYVGDTANQSIRKVTPAGVVTTLAGPLSPTGFGSVDGVGVSARFSSPRGVAVDTAGNVYVADRDNNSIRKVTATGVVTTLAGNLSFNTGSTDGTGSAARFNQPYGVGVDAAGNVYTSESGNVVIRKITPTGVVTTLAGLSGAVGSTDGTGNAVRFRGPRQIALDARGNIYVADMDNHLIRMSVFPPDFATHPVSQVVSPGVNATLTANATSNVPITYQWQKDGVAISGATITTLIVNNVQTANLGNYTLVATNMAGSTTSNIGALSFYPPPSFTLQPTSQVVNPGSVATFIATATSTVPFTYQWQKDGVALAGATNTTLIVNNVQAANLGNYVLVATNPAGSTPSSVAALAFTPPPSFTTQPSSQGVAQGATATFTANATSTLPITYQWQKDGTAIAGATATTLNVANVQSTNLGNYTLVASNSVGSTTSNVAALSFSFSNAGRLINLSILTTIPAAGDTFTMGYVVGGSGTSGTKPLVIRAAGPSLAALNVTGTLNDPLIQLFAGATKSGENDNWGGAAATSTAMANVGAFPYSGLLSLDSAFVGDIPSGDNSVRVSAAGSGTGTVIAEIYDATPTTSFRADTPRLVNVSVLKHLGTGLTVGFVIGGLEAKTVLIRAVGPTLGAAPFNVPGVVLDPQLTLFSGQTSIGSNDNWGGTAALTAAFSQVGAFSLPATARDAALVATLLPGNYTVQVSGVGGTTGVAIVEVYEVP